MRLTHIPHSNKQVNEAGKRLIGMLGRRVFSSAEASIFIPASMIVAEWRGAYAYPLRAVRWILRENARKIDQQALVSGRLKRLESMLLKLKRKPTMQLTTMQDVGGCRAVLDSLEGVRLLKERFLSEIAPHLLHGYSEDDYIRNPKADGYRSIHLVIRFQSRVPQLKEMPPRRIEIQLRSRLQHQWATAVETVDLFTNQSLKLGGGDPRWRRFFALASTIFAVKEMAMFVPDTPIDKDYLFAETKALWRDLRVSRILLGWTQAITIAEEKFTSERYSQYLIELDTQRPLVSTRGFKAEEAERAQSAYRLAEQVSAQDPHLNVVLVSAESVKELKQAFPNYYGDTTYFVHMLNLTLKEYEI